jgi:hypothetical protein
LSRNVTIPPEDGNLAPSLAMAYPCNVATTPASRKEIHTADPATAPASPSRAKMPAPTIDPTPRNAAPRTVIDRLSSPVLAVSTAPAGLSMRYLRRNPFSRKKPRTRH